MFVIYNSETGAVYTASKKDDTVIPEGYVKIETDHKFDENPTKYKYVGGEFVINEEKIAEEQATIDEIEIQNLINEKMRELATQELIKEGKLNAKGKLIK